MSVPVDVLPETPIYMLSVDGSHIHFADGSGGSTAEQMIAAVTMYRPGAKCDVTRLYIEQMMTAYRDTAVAALTAMKPNAAKHDPRPEYLRALIEQAGLSQREAARRVGISERVMRYYLADKSDRLAPYPVQYAIEQLAKVEN